ncbi:DNA translocase FtsK [Bacillus salitolerans]|uniref:DNA translocase FtsK n=1 Tax=Bacillus salitolerans TaxID=1437434 RepID=A0ABW4LW04_9BACI
MFKYIKRMVNFLTGDETKEQPKVEESPNSNYNAEVKARVVFQYPKGNFRFPLIPDNQRVEARKAKSKPNQSKPVPMNVKKTEKTQRKIQPKAQFKSTEVPSPIYGFRERDTSKDVVEFELIPEFRTSFDTPAFAKDFEENVVMQEAIIDIEQVELPSDEIKVEIMSEDSAVVRENIDLYDDQNKDKKSAYVSEVAKEQYQPEVEETASSIEEPLMNESVSQEPQAADTTQASRHYVPFNVVMLKQDRQKLEEKKKLEETSSGYHFPPLHFLTVPRIDIGKDEGWLREQQELLDSTLENFSVKAKVVNVTQGPSVTRYEVHPEPGVKVNKITNLTDDLKLALSAKDIRMEAPIPGKNTIGIEVPNKNSKPVFISEIINSPTFRNNPSPLTVALGLDISGAPIVTDLKKMPHGLIAGATGSGKSVCINAMLVSLLYKASPHEVKLLLIDPKMVELAPYNDIPHLVSPVITDVKAATAALKWAVEEMERRYERFVHSGVRDITRYNELVKEHNDPSGEMPYLVIVIDELADLMMVAPGEVEESICRIAQKARACGIHLLLATQRPSVDVITGLIKANIPTRIAFSVSSQVDSRTIVDASGAEKLLGKGDMLFLENGASKPVRLQGNFVSDDEIEKIVSHVKHQVKPQYLFEQQELIAKSSITQEEDELFYEACEFVIDQGGASSSSLQRRFRIGYNRAARLMEMMEEQGIVSEQKGSKPRDVLITENQLQELNEQSKASLT